MIRNSRVTVILCIDFTQGIPKMIPKVPKSVPRLRRFLSESFVLCNFALIRVINEMKLWIRM